jgi:DNA-binding phage protein
MAKKRKRRKKLSDQFRQAILRSAKTRYRIAQETGLSEGQLSRFVNRKGGLSLEAIDKIGKCLGLELKKPPGARKRKRR